MRAATLQPVYILIYIYAIKKVSRDGRTQTIVGTLTEEMHLYILFSSNGISMKMCRDASHLLLSLLLLFVYFYVLPSLLKYFQFI